MVLQKHVLRSSKMLLLLLYIAVPCMLVEQFMDDRGHLDLSEVVVEPVDDQI